MKRLYLIIGLLVTAASIFFFLRAVSMHWQSIRAVQLGTDNILVFTAASALYILTYISASRSWLLALRCFGVRIELTLALKILALSQFAKYLPGNIGHHVGRVLLSKRAGISGESTLLSIVVDSMMVIAAALFCSIPGLSLFTALLKDSDVDAVRTSISILATIVALVAFALLMPPFRNYLRTVVARHRDLVSMKNARTLAGNLLMHLTNFGLGGAALFAISASLTPAELAFYPAFFQIVSIYSAAWLLGFLLPGAPAGLGVRELCLLLGLSPLIGEQNALLAAAILRLVTTLSDGLVFLIGIALRSRHPTETAI
ncbi:lysylphosphatidylglycerol synthase domain-containing protein [Pseudoxanthomonas sp. UTMC 1351]|uniref:lysylphosphatidylglycerol synthase domain-containing protein n=1 Tax=Pseudoxanthomonas sp. UTMC 1351 TaxID=2695853 RepID=UPI0034CEB4C0